MTEALLEIKDVSVKFDDFTAVDAVSFAIEAGETVALVGESGSGKSMTALSVMRLLAPGADMSGAVLYKGQDLAALTEGDMRGLRGQQIGMIFQEPLTALNPLHTVERQIAEPLRLHKGMRGDVLRARIVELLELVGLDVLKDRLGAYPHQLSGGQRQRVMIAMALACEPDLLIADEPTTALDVSVQAQILDLLQDLKARLNMGLLLITHDLGIVGKMADKVCVMQHGQIVEHGGQGFAQSAGACLYATAARRAALGRSGGHKRRCGSAVGGAGCCCPVPQGERFFRAGHRLGGCGAWGGHTAARRADARRGGGERIGEINAWPCVIAPCQGAGADYLCRAGA